MTGEGTTRRIDAYDRWPGLAANILQIVSPEVEKMPSFLPPIFVILHPEERKKRKRESIELLRRAVLFCVCFGVLDSNLATSNLCANRTGSTNSS